MGLSGWLSSPAGMGNGALLGLHPNDNKEEGPEYGVDDEFDEENILTIDEKTKKVAEGIQIEGAVGIYSQYINAQFVQTGQMHNGRVLYQSLSNPEHWLRYTTDRRWMVSITKDKEQNIANGLCCTKAFGLLDPSCAKGWFVLGQQGVFRRQTKVKAKRMTIKHLEQNDIQTVHAKHRVLCKSQSAKDALYDALPSALQFEGVTGLLADRINGIYRCKKTKHPTERNKIIEDKKIFYRQSSQPHDPAALSNDSSGRWMVLQDKRVLAYCESLELVDPRDAKGWCISINLDLFSLQPNAIVKTIDGKDIKSQKLQKKKPSFRCDIFAAGKDSVFVDHSRAGTSIPTARRKRPSFSAGDLLKKESSAFMKALERMRSENNVSRDRKSEAARKSTSFPQRQSRSFSSAISVKKEPSAYEKALQKMQSKSRSRKMLHDIIPGAR